MGMYLYVYTHIFNFFKWTRVTRCIPMNMNTYICMYICIYTHAYVCVCVHIRMHAYTHKHIHPGGAAHAPRVRGRAFRLNHMKCTHLVYGCFFRCVSLSVSGYVCLCMTHTHTHTHTHTDRQTDRHTHTHTHTVVNAHARVCARRAVCVCACKCDTHCVCVCLCGGCVWGGGKHTQHASFPVHLGAST